MEKLENNINKMTIGIRFERMYKLLNSWGSIVDDLLNNNKQKYFDAEYFPKISNNEFEKTLIDDDQTRYFKITPHNLIFSYPLDKYDSFDENFKWFKNCINDVILKLIIKNHDVGNFNRIGIVYEHKFNDKEPLKKVINKIFNTDIVTPRDVKFSIKGNPPNKVIIDKGAYDYINSIYTIYSDIDNNSYIIFDYQYYFKPIIKDISLFNMDNFIKMSHTSLNNSLYSWIIGDQDDA
ncbi:MAG: hypothetical protein PWR10_1759 [Halanaerobiales bacterium]|nr:hypothetical protein [Halanaerobiales bacterium]